MSLWEKIGLNIDGESTGDYSGRSVSLSADGSRVAIGSPYDDNVNGTNSGLTRIYTLSGGLWRQTGSDIIGMSSNDLSGYSVSLSANDGSRVAIGAPFNDSNGISSGHVRIYTLNGDSWEQTGLDINGDAQDDQSGFSVSLSADGSRVAIGAPLNDSGGINSGQVRIHTLNNGLWEITEQINGEAAGDRCGASVSLSADGNRVAIGAPHNNNVELNSGHVRIYTLNDGLWGQTGEDIDGKSSNDESGTRVSLSSDGNRVAIGSHPNDDNGTNSGLVRMYTINNGLWEKTGSDINGVAAGDVAGFSVSLNSDGSKVAIGAPLNDDSGTNSGHVRIYTLNNDLWELNTTIKGESAQDQSGYSVSLSSDGNSVAIGSIFGDGNEIDSGHTRVYKYPEPEPEPRPEIKYDARSSRILLRMDRAFRRSSRIYF